jgi:hypothetical protein
LPFLRTTTVADQRAEAAKKNAEWAKRQEEKAKKAAEWEAKQEKWAARKASFDARWSVRNTTDKNWDAESTSTAATTTPIIVDEADVERLALVDEDVRRSMKVLQEIEKLPLMRAELILARALKRFLARKTSVDARRCERNTTDKNWDAESTSTAATTTPIIVDEADVERLALMDKDVRKSMKVLREIEKLEWLSDPDVLQKMKIARRPEVELELDGAKGLARVRARDTLRRQVCA